MLSLFPQLFTYQELAPLILRLAAGFIAISFGYPRLFRRAERMNFSIGVIYFCAGILLFAGLFTQLAAALVALMALFGPKIEAEKKDYKFLILIFAISVSLMLMGPGLFSIDLPL